MLKCQTLQPCPLSLSLFFSMFQLDSIQMQELVNAYMCECVQFEYMFFVCFPPSTPTPIILSCVLVWMGPVFVLLHLFYCLWIHSLCVLVQGHFVLFSSSQIYCLFFFFFQKNHMCTHSCTCTHTHTTHTHIGIHTVNIYTYIHRYVYIHACIHIHTSQR